MEMDFKLPKHLTMQRSQTWAPSQRNRLDEFHRDHFPAIHHDHRELYTVRWRPPFSREETSCSMMEARRISPDTEQKIVYHLRKKLNRRLEARLQRIIETKSASASSKPTPAPQTVSPKLRKISTVPPPPRPPAPDPRERYNEFGETRVTSSDDVGRNNQQTRVLSKAGGKSRRAVTMTLPMTRRDSSTGLMSRRGSGTSLQGTVSSDGEEDFPGMDISPVPTPLIYRPRTREESRMSRMSLEDKMDAIVRGAIHIRPPGDARIMRIYIGSAFTDTAEDRLYLIENMYQDAKKFCQLRNYELQLYDLHHGVKDWITDDHTAPDMALRLLDQCVEGSRSLSFVTFLSQKYGPALLPTVIPKEEFELISQTVTQEFSKQKLIAMAKNGRTGDLEDLVEEPAADGQPQTLTDVKQTKRRGSRPALHTIIKRRESKLKEVSDRLTGDIYDPSLLRSWYVLDENVVPPAFRLQRISSQIPDIMKNDASKYQQARNNWTLAHQKLQRMLQSAVNITPDGIDDRKKYFCSVADLEIEYALLTADRPEEQILWYQRNITDLHSHLATLEAKDYADVLPMDPEIDPEVAVKLEATQRKLEEKITENNIRQFEVTWDKHGVTRQSRDQTKVMEKMGRDLKQTIARRLTKLIAEENTRNSSQSKVYEDVVPHVKFCQEQCESFHGRKDVLNSVKRYIRSNAVTPLVLHGRSGSGKSSIMARIAKDVKKWCTEKNGVVCIVRIIGVTSETKNIRQLLRSLCLQLAMIQEVDAAKVPQDYRGLMNDLTSRLGHIATSDKHVVVLIDGLDQLNDEYNARQLHWFPRELPKHVKLIVTTLPDESYSVLPKLRSMFSSEEVYVTVDSLHESDAMIMIDHWLQQDRRNLTPFQHDKLIEAFKQCPLPLYLKLAYNESLEWESYTAESRIKLQNSIKNSILGLFTKLESKHGEPLVRRGLGYLTAARNGLTENEIEDLLSLDDAVMDDLEKMMKLQNRRCPSIAWMRLRMDLKDYIVERKADGCSPLQWYHPQFREAATERYLNQKDKAPSYHKAIAGYFMDAWADGKPVGQSEKKVDRFIAKQPNVAIVTENEVERKVYNLRKMSELPYNLLKAGLFKELTSSCLCHFTWLLDKITGSGIVEVLDDFMMALQVEPENPDLKLLSHAMFLSHKVLQNDPTQLASQLVGRLQDMITADKPPTPADPLKYPRLHPLLRQAKRSDLPSLIPSVTCLTPPDGTMFDLLSGHRKAITAVTMTTDGHQGITTSKDDSMRIWDLKSGKVTKTIKDVGRCVLTLRTALHNTMIITSEMSEIRLWSMASGECVHTLSGYVDPASITLANQGDVLAAYYDGSFVLRSWILTPEIKLLKEVELEQYSSNYHQDESISVSYNTNEAQVLAAFRGSSLGLVHNVVSGNLIYELKTSSTGSSIIHVGTSRDYFILGTRSLQGNVNQLYQLELFDILNGKYVRSIRGCHSDETKVLLINKLGSHALSVCGSDLKNTSTIAVWNLETEEHKHVAQHSAVSSMAAFTDLNFVLTGSFDESSLRIWNLIKANQNTTKLVEKSGIKSLHIMNEHSQYAVAETFEKGTVLVTNLRRDKFRGQVVMKEINIVDSQDVILFRNHIAIILTNRSNSSASTDNQQVFQTLKRFNMKTKKYESKIKDCFIYPSPSHEFRVLSEYRLMGLSENRSHFIIWNTDNGHILYRIKPNRKAMQTDHGLTSPRIPDRSTTSMMTPWDRRTETKTARQRRKMAEQDLERQRIEDLKQEKENAIEQFIVSQDETTIVASFFAHHICVFDIETQAHTGTLEDEHSMMLLRDSALSSDGKYLVLANYDEEAKLSFVTIWDCRSCQIKKRIRNEKNVCAIAINDKADRVVFGKEGAGMRIWDPFREKSLRKIRPYKGMSFSIQSRIHLIDDGQKAAVFTGDISLWDLDKAELLSVFTPDMRIQSFELGLGGELLVFGLRDADRVIALRLTQKFRSKKAIKTHKDIFNEGSDSSDSEDE